MIALPCYTHLLLKSNTAIQQLVNFHCILLFFQICTSFLQSLNSFTPQVLQISILSIMATAAI